jgi:hypothetical protein
VLALKKQHKQTGVGAAEARAVQGQDTQRRARRRDCGFHADARGVGRGGGRVIFRPFYHHKWETQIRPFYHPFFVHFTTINGQNDYSS